MTELLQPAILCETAKPIARSPQLPPDQQDAIASRFLAELQDEQKWETRFAATTARPDTEVMAAAIANDAISLRAIGAS
jgi:hypothetical protein